MTAAAASPGRGRPRIIRADAALAAAMRVFWLKGYQGASLDELTEAMGISRPSLYLNFGNKEGLFRQVLDLYFSDKMAYVDLAVAAPTARQVVEALLRGALTTANSNDDPPGCLGAISAMALGPDSAFVRDEVAVRRAGQYRVIRERFERARSDGDLPASIDPEGLAQYIDAVCAGLAMQAGSGMSRPRLEALVDTALACWPAH